MKWKKIWAVLLAFALAASLMAGCGSKDAGEAQTDGEEQQKNLPGGAGERKKSSGSQKRRDLQDKRRDPVPQKFPRPHS